MVKTLKLATLNGQLECIVNGVGASDNPIKLKPKRETHWPHKYP